MNEQFNDEQQQQQQQQPRPQQQQRHTIIEDLISESSQSLIDDDDESSEGPFQQVNRVQQARLVIPNFNLIRQHVGNNRRRQPSFLNFVRRISSMSAIYSNSTAQSCNNNGQQSCQSLLSKDLTKSNAFGDPFSCKVKKVRLMRLASNHHLQILNSMAFASPIIISGNSSVGESSNDLRSRSHFEEYKLEDSPQMLQGFLGRVEEIKDDFLEEKSLSCDSVSQSLDSMSFISSATAIAIVNPKIQQDLILEEQKDSPNHTPMSKLSLRNLNLALQMDVIKEQDFDFELEDCKSSPMMKRRIKSQLNMINIVSAETNDRSNSDKEMSF